MTSKSNLATQDAAASARPAIWGGVPLRNPHFTGRRELLERLRNELAGSVGRAAPPKALHGLGGVGKTQLALEYAYRFADAYDLIWWIEAEDPAQIRRRLIELGTRLSISADSGEPDALPAVLRALAAGEPYNRWLLVYDNAGHPDDMHELMPEGASGHILVTSRNPAWKTRASTITVKKRDKLFISYSHVDRAALDEIRVQLRALQREAAIKIWDDTQIKPTTKWRVAIKDALDSARVALLLISPDFLASDFVRDEEVPPLLEAAEKEGVKILCVILRPSLFHRVESLSQFQAFNSPEKPLSSLSRLERGREIVALVELIDELMKDD